MGPASRDALRRNKAKHNEDLILKLRVTVFYHQCWTAGHAPTVICHEPSIHIKQCGRLRSQVKRRTVSASGVLQVQ